MNNKAQIGIGVIITLAIAVIIGLILFQSIASNVEQGTRTITGTITTNASFTFPTGNNTIELAGQELVGTPTVSNLTGSLVITTGNYTVAECVRTSDNLKGICLTSKGNINPEFSGKSNKIYYSYYPDGYIDDAGARGIAGIIILLVAIGIFVIVLAGNKFDF